MSFSMKAARTALATALFLALSMVLVCGCTSSSGSSSQSAASGSTESASVSATSEPSGATEPIESPESPEPASEPAQPAVSPTPTVTPQRESTVGTLDYKKYPLIVKHDYVTPAGLEVYEDQQYTSMDEVALYLHKFGHLPSNYVLKKTARNAGWVAADGNLWDVMPGVSIGGSSWNPDDGQLPKIKKRAFYEADVNYNGGYRNSERLIFTSDGLIFYTPDHYQTYWHLY